MTRYLNWLLVKLRAWLAATFPAVAGGTTPAPPPADAPAIQRVHAALRTIKFTANPDGTFTASL